EKAVAIEPQTDIDAFLKREALRCQQRRDFLFGVPDPSGGSAEVHHERLGRENSDLDVEDGAPSNWALALSGGGIRSATFCLGVLQALAKPTDAEWRAMPPAMRARCRKLPGLLPQFDYISSVSGGSFTAGFMQSLFVPRRD